MNSRADSIAGGYQTMTTDASQQGSLRLLECAFCPRCMTFYSCPQCEQSSAQRLDQSFVGPTLLPPRSPPTLDTVRAAKKDFRFFSNHPVLDAIVEYDYDGSVLKVYGPPLDPQFFPRPEESWVPQPPYICGTNQKNWEQEPSIYFLTRGSPGVMLPNAARGRVEDMDDKDSFPLDVDRGGITIRIHFPGYKSSTVVEKTLKEQNQINGRPGARSRQLSIRIRDVPVTRAKLVEDVSKRIKWYISDLEKNQDLFPFDSQVGERWRLGQGKMTFERMLVTELTNVSTGSWSPVLYIK